MFGKYLITLSEPILGPDGKEYKSVFGFATILPEFKALQLSENLSSNWYIKVGTSSISLLLPSFQLKAALKISELPEESAHVLIIDEDKWRSEQEPKTT